MIYLYIVSDMNIKITPVMFCFHLHVYIYVSNSFEGFLAALGVKSVAEWINLLLCQLFLKYQIMQLLIGLYYVVKHFSKRPDHPISAKNRMSSCWYRCNLVFREILVKESAILYSTLPVCHYYSRGSAHLINALNMSKSKIGFWFSHYWYNLTILFKASIHIILALYFGCQDV